MCREQPVGAVVLNKRHFAYICYILKNHLKSPRKSLKITPMLFLYLTQNEFYHEGANRIQKYLGNGFAYRLPKPAVLGFSLGIFSITGAMLSTAGQSESRLQHTILATSDSQ